MDFLFGKAAAPSQKPLDQFKKVAPDEIYARSITDYVSKYLEIGSFMLSTAETAAGAAATQQLAMRRG
jgi:hypothetical protein